MKPSAFQVTRYFFLLTAAILVVFGIGSLMRIFDNPARTALYVFYAVVMFGDALLMGICARLLPKRTKFSFYFPVLVLAMNIIPTIFDQFGLPDLLFVLLNFATLVSLTLARQEFASA